MKSLAVLSLLLLHAHAKQVTSGSVRTKVLSPSEAVTKTIHFGPYNCPPLVFPSLVTDAGTRNDGMDITVHDITSGNASISVTRRVPTVPTESDLDNAFLLSNGLPALIRTAPNTQGGLRWMFHRALDIGLTRWAAPVEITALRGSVGVLFSPGTLIHGRPAFHVLPFTNTSNGVTFFLHALDPLGTSWPDTLEPIARIDPDWSRFSAKPVQLGNGGVATVANLSTTGFSVISRRAAGEPWIVSRIPISLSWGASIIDVLVLADGRLVVVWQIQTKVVLGVGPAHFPDADEASWEIEPMDWPERPINFDVAANGRLALFTSGGGWETAFYYQERLQRGKWTPAELMFGLPTRDRENPGAASGAVVRGVASAVIRVGSFLRYAQRSDTGAWATTMLDARTELFPRAEPVLWASPNGNAVVWYSKRWWLPEVDVQLQWHTIDQDCQPDL